MYKDGYALFVENILSLCPYLDLFDKNDFVKLRLLTKSATYQQLQ